MKNKRQQLKSIFAKIMNMDSGFEIFTKVRAEAYGLNFEAWNA